MSGRNILLVLVAAVMAVGIYLLATDSAQRPEIETQTPAPREFPQRPPIMNGEPRSSEDTPADAVAQDAAKQVEQMKADQAQEQMEKAADPPPMEMQRPN